jgi:Flp pilus assembly protein CpaB
MGVQPKKSSRIFMILGVALTGLAMIGVYAVSNSSSGPSKATVSILVSRKVIPADTVFTTAADAKTWFTTASYPASLVPPGAFKSANEFAKGMLAYHHQSNLQDVPTKEPIVSSMFTNIRQRTDVTTEFTIPKGDDVVSLQVPSVDAAAGNIQTGDSIDLVASWLGAGDQSKGFQISKIPTQTQLVLQNLKVTFVGQGSTSGDSSSSSSSSSSGGIMLSIAASPQTCLAIQHLKDFASSWHISVFLRAAQDNGQVHTTPVGVPWYFAHLTSNFVVGL